MKLHILSDLHNEFSVLVPMETDADVVVLAGDIAKVANGIHWARASFPNKKIIYVPGNHEFYGTNRTDTLACMRLDAQYSGVYLLDNDEVVVDGVRFLGATLWTDFKLFGDDTKLDAMHAGEQGLQDFILIREGRLGYFSADHSVKLHEQSLAWLIDKLDEPFDGKTVVVTHHLPSMLSVVERFKEEVLAACFASNLDYLFGKMELWIHGHTHDNLDYIANGTRVVCNPRGYVTRTHAENLDFNPNLVIEI
jgi:predicted phosphodiesterase